ncbi:Nucleobindin-2 [Chionoecetes opilio]|uniref:Nucleobindin-2 n=1 Tax=Chionoecetes opilio TaxID=41210 RepID=A0A8J4YB01_CHIOP|nr:Nucleobindin-2 [Chionoecetes opilio]
MKPRQTVVLVAVVCLALTQALPVKEKKPTPEEEKKAAEAAHEDADDWELNLEYGRYLKEVVQALESDQVFRKKLETAEVDDIKSGKIARELHFVDHNVRTKLDELKRRELERLRQAAVREHEKQTGVDRTLLKIPVHIDHRNPTRFEVDDLKQLITTTTKDLEKVDQERKKDFKKYEIEKEFDRQQELQEMDDSHRKEAEDKHQQGVKHHKQHDKLHHPGSKQQLEEVWEEQDHMQPEDFDPNTFFHLHDLDGNGYWDQTEVKALFKKELDKMYDPNAPEDDMMERYEEMERMREHVFRESDADKDNLISFREFVDQTKRADFEQDNGWQGLDEQQEFYSQQEYEEYERQRQEEIHRLVESGAVRVSLSQTRPSWLSKDTFQQVIQPRDRFIQPRDRFIQPRDRFIQHNFRQPRDRFIQHNFRQPRDNFREVNFRQPRDRFIQHNFTQPRFNRLSQLRFSHPKQPMPNKGILPKINQLRCRECKCPHFHSHRVVLRSQLLNLNVATFDLPTLLAVG